MSTPPLISVIVPVFNDWQRVPALLAALKAQTLGLERFELLLVDNGSRELPSALRLPPFARLLHCPTPGSYAARNAGIAHARGALLAFTDADCRPQADWLEHGLACYQRAGSAATVIAGGVVVVPEGTKPANAYELYDTMMALPQALYVQRGYGVTANLWVPRAVVEAVGGFDAGRFSGGDAEFCRRATAHGATLQYCPAAAVHHPARRDWQALVTKARRIKGGQVTAGAYRQRALNAFRTVLPPLRAWSRALRSERFPLGERLLVCLVQGRLWVAETVELARLLLKGRPRRQ